MKRVGPGSEVDAYCTKCKLDLGHRIIAMEGDRIARVECLTCRGHHNYRRPRSEESAKAVRRRGESAAKSSSARRAPRKSDLRQKWEEAIMGRSADDFTAYRIDVTLEPGQLVRHKKFGDGVVSELIEGGKAQVLFEDGPRTLVHGGV